MTDAHTPSPWGLWYGPKGSFDITIPEQDAVICSRNDWHNRAQESIANAHLIAAAPDLLRELRRSADCLATFIREHNDPGTEAMAALHCARNAIAKALP